jgi:hypothetical protein
VALKFHHSSETAILLQPSNVIKLVLTSLLLFNLCALPGKAAAADPVELTITFTDGGAHAGMPLFGELYVISPAAPKILYHPDPIQGQVTISLEQGVSYHLAAEVNGYIGQNRAVSYNTSTASETFALLPDPASGCPIGYKLGQPYSPITVLDEGFESGAVPPSNWWQWFWFEQDAGWAASTEAHTGGFSAFHNIPATDGSHWNLLVSAPMHFPTSASLTFFQKSKLRDKIEVHALALYDNDLMTKNEWLNYIPNPAAEDKWQKETFDLSSYAGRNLSLQFFYQANSTLYGDQWFVDDVKVEGIQGACEPLSGGRVAGYVTSSVTANPINAARVTGGGGCSLLTKTVSISSGSPLVPRS